MPTLLLLAGLCASATAGCYLDHSPGGMCLPPEGMVCCAPGGDVIFPSDGRCPFACPSGSSLTPSASCRRTPPPPDGGTVDGGVGDGGVIFPECPLARAVASCREDLFVRPGVPIELPIQFDTCHCCAVAQCAARVDFDAERIELSTALCPDPCDCDGCNPGPETTCALPPLHVARWDVWVNGAPAFELIVEEDSGLFPLGPTCDTFAEVDECGGADPLGVPSAPRRVDELCLYPDSFSSTSGRVRLVDECFPACGALDGPCEVRVEPRFTDDLPPGGEIRIAEHRFYTDCDVDCPDICELHTRDCLLPELVPGDTYRVWRGEELLFTFVAGLMDEPLCTRPRPAP